MARTAPADKPAEGAIMASLRASGDAPPIDDPDAEGQTVAIQAEIISDSQEAGTEVATRKGVDIEVSQPVAANHPAMVALNKYLEANLTAVDSAELAIADIIAQVLSADSVDEVLADIQVTGLLELLEVPITVHAIKFNRSSFEAGAPFYVVMDVTRHDTNWSGPVTTGAQTVIAQLVRIHMLNGYPCTLKAVYATDKPTANGYRPYKLTVIK